MGCKFWWHNANVNNFQYEAESEVLKHAEISKFITAMMIKVSAGIGIMPQCYYDGSISLRI